MNRPIYIRFINWEKYNPRKELKSLSWLRLDADIGFSESLFGLNAESKWLWIFLGKTATVLIQVCKILILKRS